MQRQRSRSTVAATATTAIAILLVVCAQPAGAQANADQEAVQLLSDDLRIDPTNPPGNEIRGAQFFMAIFDREGIASRTVESSFAELATFHGNNERLSVTNVGYGRQFMLEFARGLATE